MSDPVVYPDNLTINLPEPYLTAIGKVCVQWAALEHFVDIALHKLLGFDLSDKRTAILTAHMIWPLKMDVLTSLVAAFRPEYPYFARFDKIRPMLKKAQAGRNKIVHAAWSYEDGEVCILRATARGKLKTSITSVSTAEIDAIVDDIGAAAAALFKMIINK